MTDHQGAPFEAAEPDESVGASLARMRRSRRLTGAKLAALVGMSQPKISRIERSRGVPDPEDVAAIARALGADDSQIRALVERAERSPGMMNDWRPTTESLAGRQDRMTEWESTVEVVRDFQPALLTGLLQTSEYARAALLSFQRLVDLGTPDRAEAAVLAAVSARIRRQEVLASTSRSFCFVITEPVLRNQICAPVEMLSQIGHLRKTVARYENVVVGVIPDGTVMEIPPLHGFVLLDDELIVIDAFTTGLTSENRADLRAYRRIFDEFLEHADTDIEPFLVKYEQFYLDQIRRPPQD